MKKYLLIALAFMGSLLAVFKARGDKFKAKAEQEEERADNYQEVIEDVETANRVRNDSDARMRVETKYSRD